MPDLNVVLPHWLYWVGLIVFPLIAMALARRPRGPRRYTLPLGYLILVTGGIVGLHRFYLKSLPGLIYTALFLFILYANGEGRAARETVSDLANSVRIAERTIEREEPRIAEAEADLPALREELAAAEPGSFGERAAERRVDRAEETVAEGRERLADARADLDAIGETLNEARDARAFWSNLARWTFYAILAGLAVDAVLLPRLVRRANEKAAREDDPGAAAPALAAADDGAPPKDDRDYARNWIDRLSLGAGEFVSYWAVIAVFVYYFEVISRYVFNSPTNWAHEAMYLMFGMQYLIAGAYAMLTESHVRVDIFYAPLLPKKKAWTDLVTSIFFFIFAGVLLWTSWTFAMDALAVPTGNALVSQWARGDLGFLEMLGSTTAAQWTDPNIRWGEISFNEWEVPLWPMKWMMVAGAALLILQGISKILQDIQTLLRGGPPPHEERFGKHTVRDAV
jgi:TRAP-type mannitol/chloroaromatic compound transport system permease small subunit